MAALKSGIVRRMDDLGRIVLPKEIRRIARLSEGDPVEIFMDGDSRICLQKYQPSNPLSHEIAAIRDDIQKNKDDCQRLAANPELTGYLSEAADLMKKAYDLMKKAEDVPEYYKSVDI